MAAGTLGAPTGARAEHGGEWHGTVTWTENWTGSSSTNHVTSGEERSNLTFEVPSSGQATVSGNLFGHYVYEESNGCVWDQTITSDFTDVAVGPFHVDGPRADGSFDVTLFAGVTVPARIVDTYTGTNCPDDLEWDGGNHIFGGRVHQPAGSASPSDTTLTGSGPGEVELGGSDSNNQGTATWDLFRSPPQPQPLSWIAGYDFSVRTSFNYVGFTGFDGIVVTGEPQDLEQITQICMVDAWEVVLKKASPFSTPADFYYGSEGDAFADTPGGPPPPQEDWSYIPDPSRLFVNIYRTGRRAGVGENNCGLTTSTTPSKEYRRELPPNFSLWATALGGFKGNGKPNIIPVRAYSHGVRFEISFQSGQQACVVVPRARGAGKSGRLQRNESGTLTANGPCTGNV